jgi:hypothetical protein
MRNPKKGTIDDDKFYFDLRHSGLGITTPCQVAPIQSNVSYTP